MKLVGFLTAALCFAPAHAWPTGAGSCQGGQAATTGVEQHNNKATATSGSLMEADYIVKIDGTELMAGTPHTLPTDTEVSVELTSSSGVANFKGFLIRLSAAEEGVSTLDALSLYAEGASNLQVSELCAADGVAGLTHTSNEEKTSVVGSLMVPAGASTLMLDVTVVRTNGGELSEYFYDGFALSVGGSSMTTEAAGPTNADIQEQLTRIETKLDTLLEQCSGPQVGGGQGGRPQGGGGQGGPPPNDVVKTGAFP